ncbi:MAG: hypothetical protein KHY77_11675, partial [Butyricicoccus pullicaecorum]|nr:hypothetical protein [Butyricicoccus pullicaecorum]
TLESDVCRFIFSGFTTSTDLLLGFIPKEFQVRFQAFRCLIYKVQFLLLPFGKVLIHSTKVYFVCQELFSKFFDFFFDKPFLSKLFTWLCCPTGQLNYNITAILLCQHIFLFLNFFLLSYF